MGSGEHLWCGFGSPQPGSLSDEELLGDKAAALGWQERCQMMEDDAFLWQLSAICTAAPASRGEGLCLLWKGKNSTKTFAEAQDPLWSRFHPSQVGQQGQTEPLAVRGSPGLELW